MRTLDEVRVDLDRIDTELIQLLDTRLKLAEEVADWKNSRSDVPYTDPAREAEILESLRAKANSPILRDGVTDVYLKLFQMSKHIRHLRRVPQSPFRSVCIIGDGLIGRSIAHLIETKNTWYSDHPTVITVVNKEWSVEMLRSCDLIVIATPIHAVAETLHRIESCADMLLPGVVVIDVASVKREVAELFEKSNASNPRLSCIATHPMGGSQGQGKKHSQSTLFSGRPWVVVPSPQRVKAQESVEKFVRYCGSEVVHVDGSEHDRLVASISHMPGVVSHALVDFVRTYDPKALTIAGSGFELMTKIGKTTNTRMRTQISEKNHVEIEKAVRAFADYLHSHPTWTS